ESYLLADFGGCLSLRGKCRTAANHDEFGFFCRNDHHNRSCHLPAEPPARARIAGRADFSVRGRGGYTDNRRKWRRYVRRRFQRALSGAGERARRRDNDKRAIGTGGSQGGPYITESIQGRLTET